MCVFWPQCSLKGNYCASVYLCQYVSAIRNKFECGSVGSPAPVCRMCALCVCVWSVEGEMREWTRCTQAQFSWPVSSCRRLFSAVYFGDTSYHVSLPWSVYPCSTWSTHVTSPLHSPLLTCSATDTHSASQTSCRVPLPHSTSALVPKIPL